MVQTLVVACGLALAFSITARADITGKVVGVTDGDTITVLDAAKTQHKIRLAGIDAPEKGQPGGFRSKESLSLLVDDHEVRVEGDNKDRYGRLIRKIWVAPVLPRLCDDSRCRPYPDHDGPSVVVPPVREGTVGRGSGAL
jgi:hypothetical protein